MENNNHLIFVGPMLHQDEVGGVVILFEDIVAVIGDRAEVFDTNTKNYATPLSMIYRFVWCCLKAAVQRKEISLHGTAMDYKYLGLIILIFHFVFDLKYHTRKFAGNFNEVFEGMSTYWRWVITRFLTKSQYNFFETQYLVEFFTPYNDHTFFFPNYRGSSIFNTSDIFLGKFVFIGHVSKEKGIDKLIKLAPLLPENWSIDVYGRLVDYQEGNFSGNITYRGSLQAGEVCSILSSYSALVLPSLREGYPGIILEAYSVGLPVVVSDLPSLREIVSKQSGEIVETSRTENILIGLRKVADSYVEKRTGAMEKFKTFYRPHVLNTYFKTIGRTEWLLRAE